MANIIPPLVSDSPPPPPSEDEDDDEFDDFRESNDVSYGCDSFSLTPSPEQSPKKLSKEVPSSKHKSAFNFDSTTPKSLLVNSKEDLQINDNLMVSSNFPEENLNDLSASESSNISKVIGDDSHILVNKNNCIIKDLDIENEKSISSQLIFENKKLNQENELCDNSDILSEAISEILIEEKELKLSNGFSIEDIDSSNICLDSKILVSKDATKFTVFSKNITDREDNFTNSTNSHFQSLDVTNPNFNVSKTDFKLEDFDNYSANSVHSKKKSIFENSDLVNNENVECSNIVENKNDFVSNLKDAGNENEENNLKTDIEDEDFRTFVSHPVTFSAECTSGKSFDNALNKKENETIDISQPVKDTQSNVDDHLTINDPKNAPTIYDVETSKSLEREKEEHVTEIDDFSDFVHSEDISHGADNFQEFSEIIHNTLEDKEDNFANFASFTNTTEKPILISTNKDDGDRTSFELFSSRPTENWEISQTSDFANFTSQPADKENSKLYSNVKKLEGEVAIKSLEEETKPESDDEFGDFDDFTSFANFETRSDQSSPHKSTYLIINDKEAFTKTEEIMKDIFPVAEKVLKEFQYFDLGKEDPIFKQLQDITDTPALSYHWSKSASQKFLLKSLNIDSRNILYGHSWNSSLPRFASNLGVQPLEPVKMEPLTPTPSTPTSSVAPTSSQSQTEPQEVPSAEFDWTSSGLVNPLDSDTRDDTTECTKSEDTKPSLQSDDYDEFTSYQSSEPPQLSSGWPNVPLRETYISEVSQPNFDVDVCLQPTIVTPEMPRKIIGAEDDPGFNSSETRVEIEDAENRQNNDEKFDDFQISFPDNKDTNVTKKFDEETSQPNKRILEITTDTLKSITPTDPSDVFFVKSVQDVVENIKTSITPNNFSTEPPKLHQLQEKFSGNDNDDEDDDFTEFHSSAPLPQTKTVILTPVLELLKPVPVYSNAPSTQINWPDPGITDDDIRKFEEAFSMPTGQKNEENLKIEEKSKIEKSIEGKITKKSDLKSSRTDFQLWDSSLVNRPHKKFVSNKIELKQDSIEEDEWSDFVSVQKPSPINKAKFSDRTQTSSPDLPLSVLNLGSIQPAKQPIPVITPRGLVQTKLSTNTNSSTLQKPSNARPSYDLPPLQPSIISNQYASQAFNVGMNASRSFNVPVRHYNVSVNQKSSQLVANMMVNGQDDDEWGEFVSSPLPTQFQNDSATRGSGWSLNDGIRKTFNNKGAQNKNPVSNLALPELDFLSVKERSSVPRKK